MESSKWAVVPKQTLQMLWLIFFNYKKSKNSFKRYVIQSEDWLGKKDMEEVNEALFIEFFQCFYKLFYAIDRQGGNFAT